MVTAADAMKAIAEEAGPEGASLLAAIFAHQAESREALMPTWEVVDRTREEAYDRGFRAGYYQARTEPMERLFGEALEMP